MYGPQQGSRQCNSRMAYEIEVDHEDCGQVSSIPGPDRCRARIRQFRQSLRGRLGTDENDPTG